MPHTVMKATSTISPKNASAPPGPYGGGDIGKRYYGREEESQGNHVHRTNSAAFLKVVSHITGP